MGGGCVVDDLLEGGFLVVVLLVVLVLVDDDQVQIVLVLVVAGGGVFLVEEFETGFVLLVLFFVLVDGLDIVDRDDFGIFFADLVIRVGVVGIVVLGAEEVEFLFDRILLEVEAGFVLVVPVEVGDVVVLRLGFLFVAGDVERPALVERALGLGELAVGVLDRALHVAEVDDLIALYRVEGDGGGGA